jgi:hypothetical protein
MEPAQRSAPNAPKMNSASRKKFVPSEQNISQQFIKANIPPITHQKRSKAEGSFALKLPDPKIQAISTARFPNLSINTALASSEKPLSMERGKSPPPNFKD